LDSLTCIGNGTLIGARLGHCFSSEPIITEHLGDNQDMEGRFGCHGAAIGFLISLYFFAVSKKFR
jgi:prolipoprotein diacylglyceryltransferase